MLPQYTRAKISACERTTVLSGAQIASDFFQAALRAADEAKIPHDVIGRYMLGQVLSAFLKTRTIADVKGELLAASENIDPETDYIFMRP